MLLRKQKRSNSHICTAVLTEKIVKMDKGIKRGKPKKKKEKTITAYRYGGVANKLW